MQMCPDCESVYDESEYSKCPYCHPEYDTFGERTVIVYDREEGRAKIVPESEAYKYNY